MDRKNVIDRYIREGQAGENTPLKKDTAAMAQMMADYLSLAMLQGKVKNIGHITTLAFLNGIAFAKWCRDNEIELFD